MEAYIALTLLVIVVVMLAGIAMTSEESGGPASGDSKSFPLAPAGVRNVIDGDTVIVQAGWQRITIRLDGIDCPENDQPRGDTAKHGLIKLIGGRRIHYELHGTDKFGRALATVYVWNKQESVWLNVNLQMIMLGHAWVAPSLLDKLPGRRRTEYITVSRWARRKGVGLWRHPDPVPPWQWRNGYRGRESRD